MIRVLAKGNKKAEVLIYEQIGKDFWDGSGVTAKGFVEDLAKLGDVDEISVRINSPGGSVADGIAIYNALKQHKAKVTTQVDAAAYSIASIIAMAGDSIVMAANAMMMIHDPWSIVAGNADDMRRAASILDINAGVLASTYAARTGKSVDEIRELMKAETWMTAQQAVEMGFADEAMEALPMAASFDLSRFRNVPDAVLAMSARSDVPNDPKEDLMPTPATSATPADITAAQEQARKDALKAEQHRREQIRAAFRGHESNAELLAQCLDDMDCTAEVAGRRLLEHLARADKPTPTGGPTPRVEAGADASEKFLRGAGQAIMARAGVLTGIDAVKAREGNEFNGYSLPRLAEHALVLAGYNVRGLSNDGIARKIFATHTSSDFPQLMSNVAGKVLRTAYDNFPNTWNLWAAAGQVSDFKVHPRIQIGAFNNLDTIPEGGEYTYGALAEDYENAQAVTKGKAIALTRQMLVNDDLGAFTRRAALMGRAAARSVNSDAYAYLTSGASNNGPTVSDTGQYFNATAVTTAGGHANLTGTGTAISVASLGVGRVAMRKQKDKSLRDTLNIQPAVLLVPVAKEDLARELLSSTTDPSQSNANKPNIYRNAFTVVSDPYLDGISATAWYLFANPADIAAFEVVFLDGNQAPFMDDAVDFETDAMKFKVRLDYGIAPGDWRAGYKNVGA